MRRGPIGNRVELLGSDYFVDRLGPRCPFCGKSWSDSGPCGDSIPENEGGWVGQNERRKERMQRRAANVS